MAKKLKVGIIGMGGIARMAHCPGYASIPDEVEVVYGCDIDLPKAKILAGEYGIPKVVEDYKEILADKSIDAISVATPNLCHCQMTIDALNAGKHVLCEKPLAMTGDEAKKMCRAAKDSGKILQVGLHLRFGGAARFASDFIKAGHAGDIYYARAQAIRRRGVPGWGVFIDKEKQGGGPLIDIGVHILDFTLYLMGYPKPVSVTGKTFNQLGTDPKLFNFWGDYDRKKFTVEDMAVAFIRFDNGAIATLESSFMANHSENEEWKSQLYGTKAGIVASPLTGKVEMSIERDKQLFTMSPDNVPEVASAHVAEVQAFVRTIASKGTSLVPGENGLILNSIFDAIYKSSQTGKEQLVDVSY